MTRADDLPAWAVVSAGRRDHIGRVEALLAAWAEALGVEATEAGRWARAARLHDALRDAGEDVLRELVPDCSWPRNMLHGPAAAVRASRDGETDRGVLDAVRYHTVGYAGWDRVGRMLYLADYLEEGRTHEADLDGLRARVPADSGGVLLEVARRRVSWLLREGRAIHEETWRFWNGLVAGGW